MSDERLIDIETKLAHQEHTINELNEALANQQQSIMKLEALCGSLLQRIASLNEALERTGETDERPPHY